MLHHERAFGLELAADFLARDDVATAENGIITLILERAGERLASVWRPLQQKRQIAFDAARPECDRVQAHAVAHRDHQVLADEIRLAGRLHAGGCTGGKNEQE